MSDQPPPPKPKPGSLRDRIAAFENKGPAPAAPAPRPKPGNISWKPKAASPPSSPPPRPVHSDGSGQSANVGGGMSAADAKESIGTGGSLKERMAALQGRGAFGAPAPSPPIKPSGDKPKWKPPPPPQMSPPAEGEAPSSPPPSAMQSPPIPNITPDTLVQERAANADKPIESQQEGEDVSAPQGDGDNEEEEERQRRAGIAARMARLGGARVGMGPPVFGMKPTIPKKVATPKEETPVTTDSAAGPDAVVSEGPSSVEERRPAVAEEDSSAGNDDSVSVHEESKSAKSTEDAPPDADQTGAEMDRPTRKSSASSSLALPGTTMPVRSPSPSRAPASMPVAALPRRTAPPRKKASNKSAASASSPAPTPPPAASEDDPLASAAPTAPESVKSPEPSDDISPGNTAGEEVDASASDAGAAAVPRPDITEHYVEESKHDAEQPPAALAEEDIEDNKHLPDAEDDPSADDRISNSTQVVQDVPNSAGDDIKPTVPVAEHHGLDDEPESRIDENFMEAEHGEQTAASDEMAAAHDSDIEEDGGPRLQRDAERLQETGSSDSPRVSGHSDPARLPPSIPTTTRPPASREASADDFGQEPQAEMPSMLTQLPSLSRIEAPSQLEVHDETEEPTSAMEESDTVDSDDLGVTTTHHSQPAPLQSSSKPALPVAEDTTASVYRQDANHSPEGRSPDWEAESEDHGEDEPARPDLIAARLAKLGAFNPLGNRTPSSDVARSRQVSVDEQGAASDGAERATAELDTQRLALGIAPTDDDDELPQSLTQKRHAFAAEDEMDETPGITEDGLREPNPVLSPPPRVVHNTRPSAPPSRVLPNEESDVEPETGNEADVEDDASLVHGGLEMHEDEVDDTDTTSPHLAKGSPVHALRSADKEYDGEILDEEEGDPIDPSFHTPKRSPLISPTSTAINMAPPESSRLDKDTEVSVADSSDQQPEEDPEQLRRRTIAERMAKLGGIKFGAPPPIKRPAPPALPLESSADAEQDAEGLPETVMPQQGDSETKPQEEAEEDEQARRQRIAAKLAGMGGMRFGMLPSAMAQPTPPNTAAQPARGIAEDMMPPPPPPRSHPSGRRPIPEPQEVESDEEIQAPSDDGVRVEAEESEAEEVHYDEAEEEETEAPPPPVPSRANRKPSAHSMDDDGPPPPPRPASRPPVPTSPRPSVPVPPALDAMSRRSTRDSHGSAGISSSQPAPIAATRPPIMAATSDYVFVDEPSEDAPPPPPARPSRGPPSRAAPGQPSTMDMSDSQQWELPSIPTGALDVGGQGTESDLSASWTEENSFATFSTAPVTATAQAPPRPPPKIPIQMSADDLMAVWGRVGVFVHDAASALHDRSKKALIGDGSYAGFVRVAIKEVSQSMQFSESPESCGYLIYSQSGSAVQRRSSDIMPGDLVVITDAELKGHKGLGKYHQIVSSAMGIVAEYEAKKSKVKVFQANQHVGQQTVESVSYRLEDLKSGNVKVYRVLEG